MIFIEDFVKMSFFCKLFHFIVLLICVNCIAKVNSTCSVELERCTSTVSPLLKDITYMFPSTKDEVNRMCSVWSNIVDCVRHYAKRCFDQKRKNSFNMAVGNSIGTVHSICVSDEVQTQYLNSSTCLRDVSIKRCNLYFNQLVDIVTHPKAQDDHICCAYAKFRKCVDMPLQMKCGELVKNLMDHSLTVLIRKCGVINDSVTEYDYCQIPASLTMGAPKQQRKFDEQSNQFEQNGGFYPINPQLVSPYLVRKQQNSQPAHEDNDHTESTSRDAKSLDKVEDEFNLNQANKFSRQDDEFETDKHRDYSTESPEYMMSHFEPEELHNHSHSLVSKFYLINLLVLISVLIFSPF